MLTRAAAWLLAPLILVGFALSIGGRSTYLMGDFRAFYCAGAAVAQGANPYREEPLHACEVHAGPPAEPVSMRGVAIPAPLPPHALLAFVPLSRLPFAAAALLYALLLIAAMSASVALFSRITGASTIELNLVFAAVTASVTYFVGQPVPFALLGLAGAATFVRRERWWAASWCAAAATIEPHVALPAILGMAVLLPRTRVPLLTACGALAAAGALGLGVGETVSYVRDVLPAHALANAYEWQYSLTSLLTSVGVAAPSAIRWGELMFAAMVVIGIAAAQRLSRAQSDAAVVVLLPPAFAVFGGVHVHVQQLAVAFPAIVYVYVRYPSVRTLAATGLCAAMIPWNVMSSMVAAGLSPVLVGAFAAMRVGRRAGLWMAAGAAGIGLSVLVLALLGMGPSETHFVAGTYPANTLAETSWGDFSRSALIRGSVLMQWLRIPTLAGLGCALFAVARVAFARPQRAAVTHADAPRPSRAAAVA